MRNLTASEIDSGEIGDGLPEEGDVAVEMTLQEASDQKVGTCCGSGGTPHSQQELSRIKSLIESENS